MLLRGLQVIRNWRPLPPTSCTTGSTSPETTDRIDAAVAGWFKATSMRAPEVKSMPRFSPRPPIASAPISRMTPNNQKKYLEAPMKS